MKRIIPLVFIILVTILIRIGYNDSIDDGKALGNELLTGATSSLKDTTVSNYSASYISNFCANQYGSGTSEYFDCLSQYDTSGSISYYQGSSFNNSEDLYQNYNNISSQTSTTLNNLSNPPANMNYSSASEYVNNDYASYDSFDVVRGTSNQPLIYDGQSDLSQGRFPQYNIGDFSLTGDVYYDENNPIFNSLATNCEQTTTTTTTTNYTHVPDIKDCEKALFSVNQCNVTKTVIPECSADVNEANPIISQLDGFVIVSNCVPNSGQITVTFGCTKCHNDVLPMPIPNDMIAASDSYNVDIYSGTDSTFYALLGPSSLYSGATSSCISCENYQDSCMGTDYCNIASGYASECSALQAIANNPSHPQYAEAGNCINNSVIASCQVFGYNYNPCYEASNYQSSCNICNDLQNQCSSSGCYYDSGADIWYPPNRNQPTSGHVNAVELTCTTNCRNFNPTATTESCYEDCETKLYEVDYYGRFYSYGYCVPCLNYENYCPDTTGTYNCSSYQSQCAVSGCKKMNYNGGSYWAKPVLTTTFSFEPFKLKESLNNECSIYENNPTCTEHPALRRCLDYVEPRVMIIPQTGQQYGFTEDNFFVQRDLSDIYSFDYDEDGLYNSEYDVFIGKLCYDVERSFYCNSSDYATNTCSEYENDPNCVFLSQEPLSTDGNGNVTVWNITYDCGTDMPTEDVVNTETSYDCSGAIRCMGESCKDVTYEQNLNAGKTAAAFQALQQAADNSNVVCDSDGNCDVSIFSGEDYYCKIAVGGWQNCCEDINMISFVDYIKLIGESYTIAKWTGLTAQASTMISQATSSLVSSFTQGAVNSSWATTSSSAMMEATASAAEKAAVKSVANKVALKTYNWMVNNGMDALANQVMTVQATSSGTLVTAGPALQTLATGLNAVMIAYTAYQVADLLVKIIWACTEDELELAVKKPLKVCHYIGSYCHIDSPFGCVEKRNRYCCYDTPLARIVNEQGLPQLNRDFGTPQNPICDGFDMDEFSSLDWGQINLDEWTAYLREAYGSDLLTKNTQEIMDNISYIQDRQMGYFYGSEYCDPTIQVCQQDTSPNFVPEDLNILSPLAE